MELEEGSDKTSAEKSENSEHSTLSETERCSRVWRRHVLLKMFMRPEVMGKGCETVYEQNSLVYLPFT